LKSAEKRFAIERLTREERIQTAVHARELNDYLRAEFEDRRANPREDLITDLVHATIAGDGADRHLSEDELVSIFNQIFFAGQETSAHTMTAGLYYLISNPDQMARLRADPELTGNFVEETLRFLTPVNNIYRRVTADTELGGVALKAGDMVVLKYGSANHDERRFADPERFDITRANAKEHLAFGSGVHHCLGAELARKEITIAFRILLRRLKNIRLAQDAGPIRYTPNHILRGVAELQIEFEAA
jgi:cytochrome P450